MAGGKVTCKCGRERPFNVIACPHCTHRQENTGLDSILGVAIFAFIVYIIVSI